MRSQLPTLIARLRCEVHAAPQSLFEAGRARQPALAAHPHAPGVLAELAEDDQDNLSQRDALSLALLREHGASGAPLWSSMLIVAYAPMLKQLRHRLLADRGVREDLDQIVLCAFLATVDALARHPAEDCIPVRLRQRTQRRVFDFLRRERREHHRYGEPAEEVLVEPEPFVGQSSVVNSQEAADLSRLLRGGARGWISQGSIDVVATTVLGQEPLRDYVARVGPADRAARERMYQRLKRKRSRAMQQLRELVGASPTCPPDGT